MEALATASQRLAAHPLGAESHLLAADLAATRLQPSRHSLRKSAAGAATARYVADDIMVMYAGQIVEWGSVDSVLGEPHHPYTRLLLAAVPDPDRRFNDTRFTDELSQTDIIRRQAALPQPETVQVGNNHFIRPMIR